MTINIDRAFSLYYQLNPSEISGEGLILKNQLALAFADRNDTHKLIGMLTAYANMTTNVSERAECLAYAGLRASQLNFIELSIDLLTQANLCLRDLLNGSKDNDEEFIDIRLVSVLWCLGCAYSLQDDRSNSYGNWHLSRSSLYSMLLKERKKTITDPMYKTNILWYESILDEMNKHLAMFPEEGLKWLHRFDNAIYIDLVKQYENRIIVMLNERHFVEARHEIEDLLKYTKGNSDKSRQGAAWMVAAIAEYQMGNPEKALSYVIEGMSCYPRESHEQMCGEWMAGLISWNDSSKKQARQYLEKALIDIDQLIINADRMNKPGNTNWYGLQRVYMEIVIKELY